MLHASTLPRSCDPRMVAAGWARSYPHGCRWTGRRHGARERSAELSVAGLVLAAGGGRRYGGPKALVRHEGSLLVERAVATVRDGGCSPIVVVLGAAAAEVRAQAQLGDATLVDNEGWKSGMGSSLRVGLEALGGHRRRRGGRAARRHPRGDRRGGAPGAREERAGRAGLGDLRPAARPSGAARPRPLGRRRHAGHGRRGGSRLPDGPGGSVQTVPCEDIADDTDMDVPEPPPDAHCRTVPARPGHSWSSRPWRCIVGAWAWAPAWPGTRWSECATC